MAKVVGIDIGTRNLGYAIMDVGSVRADCVSFEDEETDKLEGWDKLYLLYERAMAWADGFIYSMRSDCEVVGIEYPYVGKSVHTAIALGALWGIIASAAGRYNIPFIKVHPSQAKKAFCNNGKASKEEVLRHAKEYVNTDSQDAADALAVAWYAASVRHR